ncbi:hypothetical protein Tco_0529330 [Tanacetum coccineum]
MSSICREYSNILLVSWGLLQHKTILVSDVSELGRVTHYPELIPGPSVVPWRVNLPVSVFFVSGGRAVRPERMTEMAYITNLPRLTRLLYELRSHVDVAAVRSISIASVASRGVELTVERDVVRDIVSRNVLILGIPSPSVIVIDVMVAAVGSWSGLSWYNFIQ